MKSEPLNRSEFILRLTQSGFTHAQAAAAYQSMMLSLETAIAAGRKVSFGKLGVLVPHVKEPRKICMGFTRTKNGVKKSTREYHVGRRLNYRFKIHKRWMDTHRLDWFS